MGTCNNGFGSMIDRINMAKFNIKGWAAIFANSFFNAANDAEHIDTVFNEAAGEGRGGSGSGSSSYFSPEMTQCVLAPYNFSFS